MIVCFAVQVRPIYYYDGVIGHHTITHYYADKCLSQHKLKQGTED